MSSIELKPCPFCSDLEEFKKMGLQIKVAGYTIKYSVAIVEGIYNKHILKSQTKHCGYKLRYCPSCGKSLQVSDNKSNRQSCKTCKYYTPDPDYRDGNMGNCQYLEKIWEKPFYVNQARAECDHYQVAERSAENGNET